MGGAQVLLQMCVLTPLWGSDCTQVTLPFEGAQVNSMMGPFLAPCIISNNSTTGYKGHFSLKGVSAGSLLAGKAERLHMCLLNQSHL